MTKPDIKEKIEFIRASLGERPIVLVGLMGAGKSAIGRLVAGKLGLAFVDADNEIETAAKMPVAEIFEAYGEPEFRRLEASVIKRIMGDGSKLLATGGGAFMHPDTRKLILDGSVSVWLSAELDLLMMRVSKKTTRPLLKNPNPRGIMADLMEKRYPTYALADIEVASQDVGKDEMADYLITHLADFLRAEKQEV